MLSQVDKARSHPCTTGALSECTMRRNEHPTTDFESLKKMIIDGDESAANVTQQSLDGGASWKAFPGDIADVPITSGGFGAEGQEGDDEGAHCGSG